MIRLTFIFKMNKSHATRRATYCDRRVDSLNVAFLHQNFSGKKKTAHTEILGLSWEIIPLPFHNTNPSVSELGPLLGWNWLHVAKQAQCLAGFQRQVGPGRDSGSFFKKMDQDDCAIKHGVIQCIKDKEVQVNQPIFICRSVVRSFHPVQFNILLVLSVLFMFRQILLYSDNLNHYESFYLFSRLDPSHPKQCCNLNLHRFKKKKKSTANSLCN